MVKLQNAIARAIARFALALAPKGSAVEQALGPIWRPGAK
jgi:hypothetical protein